MAVSFIWLIFFVATGGGLTGEFKDRNDDYSKMKFVGLWTANTHHVLLCYWIVHTFMHSCAKDTEHATGIEVPFAWGRDAICMF